MLKTTDIACNRQQSVIMQQFDFRRGGKKCCVSDQPLEPGDFYYSALIEQDNGETVRLDYAIENWDGPGDDCIGFWKQQIPDLEGGKVYWAPRDVQIAYFEHAIEKEKLDTVFVLSLLLIQKRILSMKDTFDTEDGVLSVLVDRQTSEVYEVLDCDIAEERISEIQQELAEHLFSNQPVMPGESE
jgi:hypothetical protein